MELERGTYQYWRALIALFIGSLIEFALLYETQPLLPALATEFSLSPSVASLSVSLTTGAMALTMLPLAAIFAHLKRKPTMLTAVLSASILALATGFSQNFYLLLLFRTLQGIFLAAFPAAAMAYVNEEFSPSGVGLAMGIYIAGTSVGGLGGRILVSTLADLGSWHLALIKLSSMCLLLALVFSWALPAGQSQCGKATKNLGLFSSLPQLFNTPGILPLYLMAFALMGSFVALYNYIGFVLLSPQYGLNQTEVGSVFLLYLLGTVSAAVSGGQVDLHGPGPVLVTGVILMLAGALFSLVGPLAAKITALGIFTCGFFTSHATACGWVGRLYKGDKAQAASFYLFFYYIGASVIGTGGGWFLTTGGWPSVVLMMSVILSVALWLALRQRRYSYLM